ncbi:MAG: Crp/Fnr family transcriptional regulator [Paracoccaceae bacterium]
MTTPCVDCPLRHLPCFVPMTDAEVAFMQRMKRGELVVDAGTTILLEGSASPQMFTVLDGVGLRYKTLEDGRRQVVNFAFPGDFIGLQAAVMGEMKHTFEATTRMRLCVFDRGDLWMLYRNHPERAFALTWLASVEEHFLGDALTTIGQRDAAERIAWAFVQIWRRLAVLGLASAGWVPFPYRQQDLADALGLSLVHTNKTLARLREAGLVSWAEGRLTVRDPKALEALARLPDPPEPRPLM